MDAVPPSWPLWGLILHVLISQTAYGWPCEIMSNAPLSTEFEYMCSGYDPSVEVVCENYVHFYYHSCILEYSEYDGRPVDKEDYYRFIIHIKNPREKELFMNDIILKQSTVSLTLETGNLTDVPEDLSHMTILEKITITGNKLNVIDIHTFSQLRHLKSINLTNNMIEKIQANKNLASRVKVMDISYNHIEVLPNRFLKGFHELQYLNISHNMIGSIRLFTFEGLVQLQILDLSYNNLHQIRYGFRKIHNLQELYITNNKLTELKDNDFVTLSNLERLDVRSNNISTIDIDTFINLEILTTLDLGHNKVEQICKQQFINNLKLRMISLLDNQIVSMEENTSSEDSLAISINVLELDLSGNKMQAINNVAFSNMTYLRYLNLSSNYLENIHPSAFSAIISIRILDLSHNQLKNLNFETSALIHLSKFYAHHNYIDQIHNSLFENLVLLQELDLSYNNIKELDPLSFLSKLKTIDLSSNKEMKVSGQPFENATELIRLTLNDVKAEFSFDSSNISIETLDLHSCEITNIEKIKIFNIQNIIHLNLSMNEITAVDKESFKNLSTLISLDLSLNKIRYIQPSSFLHLHKLNILILHGNHLSSLLFGVFQGPKAFKDLDLSNNMLRTFDSRLLPATLKLSLDNNPLTKFNLTELLETGILELHLNGSKIPCKTLKELKLSNHTKILERIKTTDFYSENINGIPCHNYLDDADGSKVLNTNIVSLLSNALANINKSLQSINERTKTTANVLESFIKTNVTSSGLNQ